MYGRRLFAAGAALTVGLSSWKTVSASVTTHETCSTLPSANCGFIPIPDAGGPPAELLLFVPPDTGGENIITSLTASLWILHDNQGDLLVELVSPSGTTVVLMDRPGFPACGSTGFTANNFGGIYVDGCLGSSFFAPMAFSDGGMLGKYGPPGIPCPGQNFGGGCCFCTPSFFTWDPQTPLAALNGEVKAGAWRLRVHDLHPGFTGSIGYLGLTITTEPLTPPNASIDTPGDFGCICIGDDIIGTANDPDGSFLGYALDWSTAAAGPWAPIASSFTPVTSGVLGKMPSAAPEGYVYLRLTATNAANQNSTYVKVVAVDKSFSSLALTSPANGEMVGGTVCIEGTAADYCFDEYRVEYRPSGSSLFTTLVTSKTAVINDPLGAMNSLTLADGDYDVRLIGQTTCGLVSSQTVSITVDNTPPKAEISAPGNCQEVDGKVQIIGTADDANLASWTLQYTGGATNGWVTIKSDTSPVKNGVLATWDTSALPACCYTLRLVVTDSANVNCGQGSNSSEFLVSVDVKACPADIDGDGKVGQSDLGILLGAYGTDCP